MGRGKNFARGSPESTSHTPPPRRLDLRKSEGVCEKYEESIKEYEEICVENMEKYVGNMTENVENMKEYPLLYIL